MEVNEHDFLEELLALKRDTWETIPTERNDFLANAWNFDCHSGNPDGFVPNSSFEGFSPSLQHNFSQSFGELYHPFGDELSALHLTDSVTDSSCKKLDTPPFPTQEDYSFSVMEDEEVGVLGDDLHNMEKQATCKMEPIQSNETPIFNRGVGLERKSRVKKVQGQPSKNLMAERRRRKRLNDRLSMLRSIVPKISKMDRTSILGDTIDHIKELLARIHNVQEDIKAGSIQLNLMNIFKDLKPDEITVRNSPKFDVERRNMDTRIEICCAGRPGLLLSTVDTLEALGLEIQQCVISCFNDFAMQASCSERYKFREIYRDKKDEFELNFILLNSDLEQRATICPEDIKQALFRNAGYGGRCL